MFNCLQKLKTIVAFHSTLRNISVCIVYVRSWLPQIWAFCQSTGRVSFPLRDGEPGPLWQIHLSTDRSKIKPSINPHTETWVIRVHGQPYWDHSSYTIAPAKLKAPEGAEIIFLGENGQRVWGVLQVRLIELLLHSKSSHFSPLHIQMYYITFINSSSLWYLVKKSISTVFLLLLVLSFSQNCMSLAVSLSLLWEGMYRRWGQSSPSMKHC